MPKRRGSLASSASVASTGSRAERAQGRAMRYFPLFADLQGRRVLVVGGGAVAERKVRLLLEAGADVVAVAPEFTFPLPLKAGEGQGEGTLTLHREHFKPNHLDNV